MQLGSFNSVHAYRVSRTDRDWILIFACLQERTEPEEAERRDRAEEDMKKAEAAKRQKQADEEQEQKVTFQERTQSSAVTLSRFCARIVFISLQLTQIGLCFLRVPRSAPTERRQTERRRRRQSVKSK